MISVLYNSLFKALIYLSIHFLILSPQVNADSDLFDKRPNSGLKPLPQNNHTTSQTPDPLIISKFNDTLKGHYKKISRCYTKELKRSPKLSGKISLSITVNSGGKVLVVSEKENSFYHNTIYNCIASQIKRIEFTKPKYPTNFSVSYFFHSN